MTCDWEGNRRSGVALAMRHRLKWFIRLRAQGPSKGNEHPTNTLHGVWYSLPFTCKLVIPLPSNRHHWSCGDCLEGKGENYQVCSVQYCVQQLCTVQCTLHTHMNRLTVLWIGFCLTGPISLCLD